MTQAARIARVEETKRPADAAPWHPPVAGTQYWLCLSELEAASLAQGIVLVRTQQQARNLTHYLQEE